MAPTGTGAAVREGKVRTGPSGAVRFDLPGIGPALDHLRRTGSARAGGLWGSSRALFAARAAQEIGGPVLVIVRDVEEAARLRDDLAFFGIERAGLFAPAVSWMETPRVADLDPETLRILAELGEEGPPTVLGLRPPTLLPNPKSEIRNPKLKIVVAPADALSIPLPPAGWPASFLRVVRRRDLLSPREIAEWLAGNGYEAAPAVENPGEFLVRGGIVDVFPLTAEGPVRIEFTEDRVESLRSFDPATQRSRARCAEASLPGLPGAMEAPAALLDHFSAGGLVLAVEGAGEDRILTDGKPRLRLAVSALPAAPGEGVFNFRILALPLVGADPGGRLAALRDLSEQGIEPFLPAPTKEERARIEDLIREYLSGPPPPQRGQAPLVSLARGAPVPAAPRQGPNRCLREPAATVVSGNVTEGFCVPEAGFALVPPHELFGRAPARRRVPPPRETRPLDSFLDLQPGDLIVHVAYGIARFLGTELVTKGGRPQEFLVLEYARGRKLYVPVTQIDLCERYIGSVGRGLRLDNLGGKAWSRRKVAAERAVHDLAAELIEIQALRSTTRGFAFPGDDADQLSFEASFPFEDTPDQGRAGAEIKRDMESERPMDRLVCGDVGFGKTELAVRAAFKAVHAGKQVAVLVPTTILAEQHLQIFSQRFGSHAIRVEALSRFRDPREQEEILAGTREGQVDVLIGTHRLLGPDVLFRDLGLVVIDEEQRFGVVHKEGLKRLRATVDVLTLTATPIPRTLHLTVLGVRGVSTLKTPPPDRLSVETHVVPFDKALVAEGIRRELGRGGQTFFLHNKVHDIEAFADGLRRIVPEARLGIAHGQLDDAILEARMVAFLRQEFDVLVTTTIIASGVDMPNVNTIFIDNADRFGLADLHQLRGRVGRSSRRAYAYLLLSPEIPPGSDAAKRLKAIEQYRDLGAGFKIAMKDLEIRGAGNILGKQQHGHIEAVGYDLYCRLLDNAVRRAKNEPVPVRHPCVVDLNVTSYIPEEYIPIGEERMNLYKRLTRAQEPAEVLDIAEEARDRFGPLPRPVRNLLAVSALRCALEKARVRSLTAGAGYLRFECRDEDLFLKALGRRAAAVRRIRPLYFTCALPEEASNEEAMGKALRLWRLEGFLAKGPEKFQGASSNT